MVLTAGDLVNQEAAAPVDDTEIIAHFAGAVAEVVGVTLSQLTVSEQWG